MRKTLKTLLLEQKRQGRDFQRSYIEKGENEKRKEVETVKDGDDGHPIGSELASLRGQEKSFSVVDLGNQEKFVPRQTST